MKSSEIVRKVALFAWTRGVRYDHHKCFSQSAAVCYDSPVVVTPCELLLHIPTGLQAGQGLDHLTEQNYENCTHTHFQINFTIHVSEGRQQGFGFMRIKR